MKIYQTRYFYRWAKKENITAQQLTSAVAELEQGLHDGNLGHHVYKKRIARKGQGKRGSYRSIVGCRLNDKAFFIYGYAKSGQATLSNSELKAYQDLAEQLLHIEPATLKTMLKDKKLIEVKHG